jgi:predicted Zn-dependent protease
MLVLLSLVVILSLADLYLTLLYVTQGSFAEANPLARAIIRSQSVGLLVAWKFGSVLTTVGILYAIRRTRTAEVGAWICCAVLGWLTFQWSGYVEAPPVGVDVLAAAGYDDGHWVTLIETE